MLLPHSNILPVRYLASVFDKTTTSYKFYWFLAIVEHVSKGAERVIPVKELLARMISRVWYPVNYFKISFGKQDRLRIIADAVKAESHLNENAAQEEVFDQVLRNFRNSSSKEIRRSLQSLLRYVPYRFLHPWFTIELRGLPDPHKNTKVVELADLCFENSEALCFYRFVGDQKENIELQKDWFEYLREHSRILTDFCYWNLLNYLQKNNPNVPNIAEKLFAPQVRSLATARKFWRLVLSEYSEFQCIYSDAQIARDQFSIDHFVPWRFVTHDLLWNLVPVPKVVNSAKSDSLPALDQYFGRFAILQHEAFGIAFRKNKTKMLEDYTNLYQIELKEIYAMPKQKFVERLRSTIVPLVQIAENMGFQSGWVFKK